MDDSLDPLEDSDALRVQRDIKAWKSQNGDWLTEAEHSFDMVAGRQWSTEDQSQMDEQGRPTLTMNRIAALVRGVCGLEVSNRQEAQYIPRGVEDSGLSELLNGAAKYMREQCDAEDEESEAFRDMLICGVGGTDEWVDYDEDPAGMIVKERVDPMLLRWDAAARKRGLTDAKWRGRMKKMSLDEVKRQWPEKAEQISISTDTSEMSQPHDDTSAPFYQGGVKGSKPTKVEVVQYQYCDITQYVKIMTQDGQQAEVKASRVAKMRERIALNYISQPYKKKVYYQLLTVGSVLLEKTEIDGFSIHFITGQRDRNQGTWYGMVRDVDDPQKWSNKFFSSMIDSIAKSAKGGLIFEIDAVKDPKRMEEVWTDPSGVVALQPGGLAKVKERNAPPLPANLVQAMQFAIESLPAITGINLEFLGLANRAQAGVLEQQRKQSVISGLAEYFAALRLYRKNSGRYMMTLIMKYLADGRMIRISGPNGPQNVPLPPVGEISYDVIVDENPSSSDVKQRTWEAIQAVLPTVLKQGIPVPPEVLDYAPLPSSLAQKWKESITKGTQIPQEVQDQIRQMQEQMQKLSQENQQLKMDQQADVAKVQSDHQIRMAEMEAEHAHKMHLMQQEREQWMLEMQQKREAMKSEFALKAQMQEEDINLMWSKVEAEVAIKQAAQESREELDKRKASWTLQKQNGKVVSARSSDGRTVNVKRSGDNIEIEED